MLNSLNLKNITCTLGKQTLLNNASLELARGEMHFLVGESGAGKTILSNLVMGQKLPNAKLEGQIFIDDKEVSLEDLKAMRGKALCYIPQATTSLNPLKRYDSRYPHEMSGGMQKLALVDYCLNRDAEIFVIDEPTTGLDESKAELVMSWFAELNAQGKTLLIVSHDMNLAFKFATKISYFKDGTVNNDETYHQLVIDSMPKNATFKALTGSICYFGETGSGKTTFAKTLIGPGVQMVFQNPYSSFNPKIRIGKSPEFANKDQSRLKSLMTQFKLKEEMLSRFPGELSGGELQRLSLIRAILQNPKT